jgi:FAD/FMN-containing dehydrogenase
MNELERLVGVENVQRDVTVGDRMVSGTARALVHPGSAEQVAEVVAWCYAHDVPIVPVGGGSGLAGGAAALNADSVAIALHRLDAVRSFDPQLWRMQAEAGVTTATIARLARENGLLFGPDPGAPEDSQLGGMIATNAGGPHSFKYGVTGDWVTGIEAVLAPGDLVRVGGPLRKDVAGYDLRALLVGSEGTLGIVTAAWLRFVPAPERQLAVLASYADTAAGTAAVLRVLASGVQPAALEYFDAATMRCAGHTYPGGPLAGFVVLAEADGSDVEADRVLAELLEALAEGAVELSTPQARPLWRWRESIPHAVATMRGAKLSEDIAVPLDRLGEAIEGTLAIGERHGLEACSWGHAGDGNLHATFLLDGEDEQQRGRADSAAEALFDLALGLGGSITGEHGIGLLKAGRMACHWDPAELAAQRALRAALDPKGLFNPGKKEP